MDGFREFFNLSRSEVNSTVTCSSEESSEETSALLVTEYVFYLHFCTYTCKRGIDLTTMYTARLVNKMREFGTK